VSTLRVPVRPTRLLKLTCLVAGLLIAGDCLVADARGSDVPHTLRPKVVQKAPLGAARTERPRRIEDPLFPGRTVELKGELDPGFDGLSARPGSVRPGLLPSAHDRLEKPVSERGGVDPCQSPDNGFGIYKKWRWGTGMGKILVPEALLPDPDRFDLVVHFAGHELARKEVARASVPFAFMGVSFDGGVSLDYRQHVGGPQGLWWLTQAAEGTVRALRGRPQAVRKLALASWSAGYAGVGILLEQSNLGALDAVILLDGLHTSREEPLARPQLEPFVKFAERAARGDAFMFVSYSSIGTDGYASTHESARRLILALGGLPLAAERLDPGGMELKEVFSRGGFHARGYRGGGKLDHCAHLMLYPLVAEALGRRWGISP
jgi:hypothetical protein